ncbi:hypothetical protein H9Q08_15175 [Chryseobacterium sp. PS-8]|uniref:Immunity protein 35 domain-containing protein n=1 Tax=Chryseobacterium indicum TaxID=2766954 RepID=A0ABS9C8Y0_9FLAO|nr:hypothetical protein [Chryseobacterium sp. PS-8]MCF2220629.1 hypothetical protein [Chryseobacterium sp. PS-8]
MLSNIEMVNIAKDYVEKISQKWEIELTIAEEYSIQKNYGMIFYFNSKKYVEDKIERAKLIGCSPFLVESRTGKVVVFGTNRSIDYYTQEYEAGKWPNMPLLNDF